MVRRAGPQPKDYELGVEACQVVWFDPGVHTGWAVFCVHPAAIFEPGVRVLDNILFWDAGTFVGQEHEVIYECVAMAKSYPEAALGTEDFIVRQYNQSRDFLSPVRINAAVDYEMWLARRPMFYQQPSTRATAERVKAWGFAPDGGSPHSRDATAHALTFLQRASATTRQGAALRRLAWGGGEG